MKIECYIREAENRDINFIKNSWQKNFASSMKHVPLQIYHKNQDKLITKLMGRSTCYVACNPEDFYQIFGWILFDTLEDLGILHYIYVKHPFRRYGIASVMLGLIKYDKSYPIIATHYSHGLDDLKKKFNITFNPYFLLGDTYAY